MPIRIVSLNAVSRRSCSSKFFFRLSSIASSFAVFRATP
jgi:hypothetical protein